jgi:hypothetical protein
MPIVEALLVAANLVLIGVGVGKGSKDGKKDDKGGKDEEEKYDDDNDTSMAT